jgi:hypothetical protein
VIKNRVSKLIGKVHGQEPTIKAIVLVCKYFGWTLEDVQKLTIGQFFETLRMIDIIEKEAKESSEKQKFKHG